MQNRPQVRGKHIALRRAGGFAPQRLCVAGAQRGIYGRIADRFESLAELLLSLPVFFSLKEQDAQIPVRHGEIRVHFQRAAQLLQGFVVAAGDVQNPAQVRVGNERKRIERQSFLHFGEGFLKSRHGRQKQGIPAMTRRLVGVKL